LNQSICCIGTRTGGAPVLDHDLQAIAAIPQGIRHIEAERRRAAAMAADMDAVDEDERRIIRRSDIEDRPFAGRAALPVEMARIPGGALEIGPFRLQQVPAGRNGHKLPRLDLVIARLRPLRRRRLVEREPALAQALVEEVQRQSPVAGQRQHRPPVDRHVRLGAGEPGEIGPGVVLVMEMMERIVGRHHRAPSR
jgi:hypothetical protein